MTDRKRGRKTKYRLPQNWRSTAAALLILFVMLGCVCSRYFSFVSQTVYQESTSHLSELVHKSDNMLSHLVRRNRTLLHLWNDCMKNASSEEQIRSSLNEMQKETGCAALYFLASDGSCMTPDGERGSLSSQVDLNEPFSNGEDIVLNAALPGKPQMLVFICPETQGTYRGFAYDAVAIAYYNNVVLNALDNTAFGGAAHSYVIYPDGRVVLDSSADSDDPVYNLLAELREHSDLTGEKLDALSADLASGRNGSRMLTLHGTQYYLVYESTGIQDWTILSLVPVSIVNASMNRLWFRTIEIVVAVMVLLAVLIITLILRRSRAALRRKDTDILYRDELFNRLSHNVDDVFLMLDGETSHPDYISPNIERLLGLTLEQVRQDVHILAALHEKDSPSRDTNFLEGLQRGEQREWDTDYIHQETGERRWFHIVAMGTEAAGRTKYILVLSDRTADREVNQALSDAVAAAQSASRAKSDFLTNMSHDIRTPMNAIIGFTSLAATHIDNREQVLDYLKKTATASQHLLSLINDVLDMSRIESGKVSLELRPVHLPELVHDLRDIIQSSITAKRISLFIDMVDVEDEDVVADPMRLNQIMLNILSNAIKFTPVGGMITLRIVQKQTAPHGSVDYEFHIRDTGIGMSSAFQEHIFEQFAREETSTVSKIQGTGLGMAITKNLVDMMGGSISVESEPGKGSEFTVSLRFPISGEQAAPQRIPQLEGLRALVADDDTDTCLNVSKMLRMIGMRSDWTTSGHEAVVRTQDAIEQGDGFDVFIIDWMIPDLNGLEVVRRIRRLIGSNTPIIILTAYDWADIEVEAKAAGVTAFCAKPLFMSELRRILAEPFLPAEAAEQTEKKADFAGKRLLVVEDNALNREIAVTMLEEGGFEVDTAENGKIAVDKVRESAPGYYDLVLMDIQMPIMDGYAAARAIRALPDAEKAGLPIVAMTANAFDEDRQNAEKAGMNGHLSKPFDMQQLLTMLREKLSL